VTPDQTSEEAPLARLTVPARLEYLPSVLELVRQLAALHGLGPRSAERTAFMVEEACANIMEHAYLEGESGTVDLSLRLRPAALVFTLDDQGMPFDFRPFEQEERSSLTGVLGRSFQGKVCCRSRGRAGNRVELTVPLPRHTPLASLAEKEIARAADAAPAPGGAPLELRLMTGADAEALTRCLYRTYGYSYFDDYLYDPDEVRRRLKSGLLSACVAGNAEGEIVGYLSLVLEPPGTLLGEAATGIVDPRYRGHHLFERMKGFLRDYARQRGLRGIYSEAVTAHPYTQKGSLALGAHEVGILLADLPAGVAFKAIGAAQAQRAATVMLYLPVNPAPPRDIWAPPAHAAMITHLYQLTDLPRTVRPLAAAPATPPPAGSQLEVHVDTDVNEAYLTVRSAGDNLERLARFRLRELCQQRIDVMYVDLPLTDPQAMTAAQGFESLGFFFAGVVPEKDDRDVLRLQYLNRVATDPQQIQVASDFGRELRAYVLRAQANARRATSPEPVA
jgi:anti-sigma regulatory factor (Ser/Thr protein kinase)